MLQTYRLTVDHDINPADVEKLVSQWESRGWIAAIVHSDRTFRQLAGIIQPIAVRALGEAALRAARDESQLRGDLFFRDSDLYYLIRTSETRSARRVVQGGRSDLQLVTTPARIELGILSEKAEALDERLRDFADSVAASIQELVGAKAGQTKRPLLVWQPPTSGSTRLASIIERAEEESIRFEACSFLAGDLEGAKALAESQPAIEFLQDLNKGGFLRRRDLQARQGKRREEINTALKVVSGANLINTETLLECKRTGNPLTRLSSAEHLKTPEVANLICPSCGSRFSDESTSEGYSVSELGRRLITKSHWMTVWITHQLCELGVPQASILWNLSEAGEEVDVVVEFLGELWVFELKDREFGAGDAHAFNYRRVRYQPTKALIVTTDKVSRDAKRVFDDLAKDAQPRGKPPIYIEGLPAVQAHLRAEMSGSSISFACRRLERLGNAIGYDLTSVVSTKFQDVPVLVPDE